MPVLRVLVVVLVLGAATARGGRDCAFAPTTGMILIPVCPYGACAPGMMSEFRLVPSDSGITAGIARATVTILSDEPPRRRAVRH